VASQGVSVEEARDVYVGTGYGIPANRFYNAAGLKVVHSGSYWEKEL
jgi:hypothetical protein